MTEDFSRRFAAARRQIIEKEYADLNPEQREAVLTTEGPLLLLAGAGSGKTTVLIHRVGNILRFGRGADTGELPPGADEEMLAALEDAAAGRAPVTESIRRMCAVDPAAPWQVLAITFTNKAADELKSRLEIKLGETGRDVWALTFHGACVRILRRDADRLGFPKGFTIYDQADSLSVMKRILRDKNVDDKVFPPKAMLAAASRYKGALIAPEDAVAAEERTGDIRRIRTAQICAAYAKHLRDAGAMDFDDLLYYTVRLLQDEPDVLAYYQRKFRYVLIDEYQDTNHLQYLFAALMASGSRNICVVGDDDQSIYKFRGATIENILSFEKQYPEARVIRLEQNYRSTGNILAAANAVIANNRERKGKTLWTAQSGGDPVTLYEAHNEDDEADFVARTIRSARRPMRDFAVLYRTNAQSRSIELAFKRRAIPYRIFGGTRFFDRAEVKDILAYLNVIANPTDETRLLRIVNEPPRGIGVTSLERIREIAAAENIPLFEAMSTASHRAGVSAGKKMEEFCRMITELQSAVSALPLDAFYDAVVERTGYALALETKGGDENVTRLENIAELKSGIVKSMETNPDLDLYSYLDEVALYTDMDNYDRAEDAAVMMTMHAAKGLEFPYVFVVGMEDGVFPGDLARYNEADMEEERRLCYVAITRAKKELYLSSSRSRLIFGQTRRNPPSTFLTEIDPDLLDETESPELAYSGGGFGAGYGSYSTNVPGGRSGYSGASRGYLNSEYNARPRGGFGGGYSSGFASGGHESPNYQGGRHAVQSTGFGTGYARNNPHNATPAGAGTSTLAGAPTAAAPKKKQAVSYAPGDLVEHRVFGKGKVLKATPIAGDCIVEIQFDRVGIKKTMANYAPLKKLTEE